MSEGRFLHYDEGTSSRFRKNNGVLTKVSEKSGAAVVFNPIRRVDDICGDEPGVESVLLQEPCVYEGIVINAGARNAWRAVQGAIACCELHGRPTSNIIYVGAGTYQQRELQGTGVTVLPASGGNYHYTPGDAEKILEALIGTLV